MPKLGSIHARFFPQCFQWFTFLVSEWKCGVARRVVEYHARLVSFGVSGRLTEAPEEGSSKDIGA